MADNFPQRDAYTLFLEDLAMALQDHNDMGYSWFVDLTDAAVRNFSSDCMDEDLTDDDIEAMPDWLRDDAIAFRDHDLVIISAIPSYESFKVLESFADSRPAREQDRLFQALNRKHPFSNFKHVVDMLDIRNEWHVFKNANDRRIAEEWLREEGLVWNDGTVTRKQE